MLEQDDLKWFVKQLRILCLVFIYSSLFAAIAFPSLAIDMYDQGIFPFRLSGTAGHANGLAPLGFLFIIVNRLQKNSRSKWNLLHNLAALMIIVLAQSKTTWIAIIIIAIATWFLKINKKSYLNISISLFSACGALFGAFLLMKNWYNRLSSEELKYLFSFSGRNVVWDFTVELWKLNPLFGYGLSLWRDETRLEFLSMYHWAPAMAHNQFFQTLGQSGVFGVLGLTVYLFCLLYFAINLGQKSNWTIFAIVCLLIIRGFSENSLESNLFIENFIIQYSSFALIMLYLKAGKDEKQISIVFSKKRIEQQLVFLNDRRHSKFEEHNYIS
jgi:O-antigen ligase